MDGRGQVSSPFPSKGWILRIQTQVFRCRRHWPGERSSAGGALALVVVAVGPVSEALRASLDAFQFYKEGKHLSA